MIGQERGMGMLTRAEWRHNNGKQIFEATFEDLENLRHKISWRQHQGVKFFHLAGVAWLKRAHRCSTDLLAIFVSNLCNSVEQERIL